LPSTAKRPSANTKPTAQAYSEAVEAMKGPYRTDFIEAQSTAKLAKGVCDGCRADLAAALGQMGTFVVIAGFAFCGSFSVYVRTPKNCD